MARAKFYNKETGSWEYADNAYGSSSTGADGGYYTPMVDQTDENTMTISFIASNADLKPVEDQNITLPAGPKGDKYELTEADKQEIAELTASLVDVPESGGSAEWRKVAEIKTTEDLTYISVTEDMDGNPLSFDEAILVFASARASDATTNGSVAVSAYPQWASSFNKYGIHSIPLNADVYALSAHIKKHGELVEIGIDNRSRIIGNLQGLTVWGSEAYGFTVGQLFTNYATRSLRYHRDTNVQNGIYQPSTKTLFDDSGKLMGVTIGTDLATSIKIGAGSTLEVWVR